MKNYFILITILCSQFVFSNEMIETPKNPELGFWNENYTYALLEDCDACGCSANGGSMGFSSMLDQNFVGLRYLYQSYKSRDGVFNNSPWIDENFNTLQAWARIPITERIEVMGLVPYHFNNREKSDETQNINGIGDITLMGFYTLIMPKNDSIPLSHRLQVGAGVKLPTGTFDSENNGSVNPSFQLGTGSWDFTLASEYTLKRNKLGFNAMANYIFKTENNKEYKFGNQFNYGGTFFYVVAANNIAIVPQLGLAGEVYESNEEFKEDVPLTKGDIFFGKAGVELGLDRFSLGINAMLPLTQNLTGGRVEANYRLGFNLNYSL